MKKLKWVYKACKAIACVVLTIVLVVILFGCRSKSLVSKASKKLNNYTILATLCSADMVVSATEVVDYTNRTGVGLDFICFNLYGTAFSEDATILPYTTLNANKCFPNGVSYGDMEIVSTRVNGLDAQFNIIGLDNNALQVVLGFTLNPEESVSIEIVFNLKLANCTHRLGYYDNFVNLGNWYPVLAVFENGEFNITPYYSSGDPFYTECANYLVTFYHQDNLKVAHTGNLKETSVENNIVCDVFSALAVRDFALVLSSAFGEVSGTVGSTKVVVMCDEGDPNKETYLKTSMDALTLFNSLYGEYPYETLYVAFTPFLHGGMEYPNLVYIANDIAEPNTIAKVVVHEIAHQWWYGVVGNNEITNAWFDESLAEYSTLLFFENFSDYGITREKMIQDCLQDYSLYLDVVSSVNLKQNLSMQLPVNEYLSEYEYVYMVYVKGTIFIDELRKNLGDADFFKGLKTLYKDNTFKIVTKAEFIDAFNSASGVDVTAFVEGWLSGNTKVE